MAYGNNTRTLHRARTRVSRSTSKRSARGRGEQHCTQQEGGGSRWALAHRRTRCWLYVGSTARCALSAVFVIVSDQRRRLCTVRTPGTDSSVSCATQVNTPGCTCTSSKVQVRVTVRATTIGARENSGCGREAGVAAMH